MDRALPQIEDIAYDAEGFFFEHLYVRKAKRVNTKKSCQQRCVGQWLINNARAGQSELRRRLGDKNQIRSEVKKNTNTGDSLTLRYSHHAMQQTPLEGNVNKRNNTTKGCCMDQACSSSATPVLPAAAATSIKPSILIDVGSRQKPPTVTRPSLNPESRSKSRTTLSVPR